MSRGVKPTNIRFLGSSVIFKVSKYLGTHDKGQEAPWSLAHPGKRGRAGWPSSQTRCENSCKGRAPPAAPLIHLAWDWELAEDDMRSASTATFSPSHPASPPTVDPTDLQPTQDTEATTFQKLHGSRSSVWTGPIPTLVLCRSQWLCSSDSPEAGGRVGV